MASPSAMSRRSALSITSAKSSCSNACNPHCHPPRSSRRLPLSYAQFCPRHAVFMLLLAAALSASDVQAQDQALPQAPQSANVAAQPAGPVKRHPIETSVSLGAAAQLTATRVTQPLGSQSFDPSVCVLGSVRQSFRPWLGYSANFGYTRTTEENGSLSYFASRLAIPSNVYELSLAYMIQKHITPRLTGFADLGAGVLTFLPVHRGSTASASLPTSTSTVPSVLFRQLGVAGVGVDYYFNSHLALRAEYRGLLYKYPNYSGLAGRLVTVSSQPTLSVTYTFGRGKKH